MSKNNPAIETEDEYKKEILLKINKTQDKPNLNKAQHVSEIDNKWNMNNKIIELFATTINNDQNLKGKYAIILIAVLIVELILLNVIFILKGMKVLEYSDTTFNIFITAGIAEVFVLVRVIVRNLFKDNLTEALKIIIETNNKPKYNKYRNNKNYKKNSDKP